MLSYELSKFSIETTIPKSIMDRVNWRNLDDAKMRLLEVIIERQYSFLLKDNIHEGSIDIVNPRYFPPLYLGKISALGRIIRFTPDEKLDIKVAQVKKELSAVQALTTIALIPNEDDFDKNFFGTELHDDANECLKALDNDGKFRALVSNSVNNTTPVELVESIKAA